MEEIQKKQEQASKIDPIKSIDNEPKYIADVLVQLPHRSNHDSSQSEEQKKAPSSTQVSAHENGIKFERVPEDKKDQCSPSESKEGQIKQEKSEESDDLVDLGMDSVYTQNSTVVQNKLGGAPRDPTASCVFLGKEDLVDTLDNVALKHQLSAEAKFQDGSLHVKENYF
jgi:hypothetical protein